MKSISAFVDESGTVSLSPKAERYFVVCAAFLDSNDEEELRTRFCNICNEMKFGKEIKSSNLSTARRLELLGRLKELPFHTFFLIVDKNLIDKDSGLKWKPTAFKYLNRRLYDRLYHCFESTSVIADEHGRNEFMNQFETYLERELGRVGSQGVLFPDTARTFRFQGSEKEPLVQLADVYAGTLRRQLEGSGSSELLLLLQQKATCFVSFPSRAWSEMPKALSDVPGPADSPHDLLVRSYCGRIASDFTEQHFDSDEHHTACLIVDYLLSARGSGSERFVSTAEMRTHLLEVYRIDISDHQFRSTIVAPLRDRGVILASGNEGYKIPTTVKDIKRYVELTKSMVIPMLERLAQARSQLSTVSRKELDILGGDDSIIEELLNSLSRLDRS